MNNQINSYKNQINSNSQKILNKEQEINKLDIHTKELELSIEKLNISLEEFEIKYNELLNKKQLISEQLLVLKDSFDRSEKDSNELRNIIDNLNKNIHNLEISKTQIETASNNILQRLSEEFQLKNLH